MNRNRSRSINILCVLLALSLMAIAFSVSSCGGTTTSKTYQSPSEADFSKMTWSQAFQKLNEKMTREYAFTQWKSVDFDALYKKYGPRIAKAEAAKDFNAYYLALREYLFSIPDGHIFMPGDDRGVMKAAVGGGFGVVAMKLGDGKVVAARVSEGSPAAAAGMKTGAEIVTWGGKPVAKALSSTSVIFAFDAQATDEDVTYQQLRFLVRAPIGSMVPVSFKNQGETVEKSASLTATDDNMETLDFTNPAIDTKKLNPPPTSMVSTKMLPGNIGYVKVIAEGEFPADKPGDHIRTATAFKNAIDSFIKAGVAGIVVDDRGNLGGSDGMVADFMSSFYSSKTLYEYQNWYNAVSGKFEIWLGNDETGEQEDPGQGLYIVPATPTYDGTVVALVNTGTISSGEGIAMGIKNLPDGKVVGFWGTNGSFGMAGDNAIMPEGLSVSFPFGQSLDKDKVVQLDSRDGKGGVTPTTRIPMTLDNALKWGAGQDVVLDAGLRIISESAKTK